MHDKQITQGPEGQLTREDYEKRHAALKTDRASFIDEWQDLSDFIHPRAGRFEVTQRNKGGKRRNRLVDNKSIRARKILGAGMMAGASSPARPWYNLLTPHKELNDFQPVKVWLFDVAELLRSILRRSNSYNMLQTGYEELGVFGTFASFAEPNFQNVIHHHTQTIGQYCLATDYNGKVNTIYREFMKTTSELIMEYGKDNVSEQVREAYKSREYDRMFKITHLIEPRFNRDPSKGDSRNMPYASIHYEQGNDSAQFLRVSGLEKFRVLAPRWYTAGGDVYGTDCPGMDTLGDIKQLQHEQKSKSLGIEYQVKPPLQIPTSLRNQPHSTIPGGTSYYDATGPNSGIRTAFETKLELNYLLEDIRDIRERIDSGFYADLFLMLANATDTRMTATEVAQRHEEKLLMLGPVMERLHNELLEPLIQITFDAAKDAGILPPPPPELEGVELQVEFVSMLAQAQKAIGVNSIDRYVARIMEVASAKPEVLDKFDQDAWVDEYTSNLGVAPTLTKPDDVVNQERKARAEAAAKQQELDAMEQGSHIAQNTAAATAQLPDEDQPNAIDLFSGYNSV